SGVQDVWILWTDLLDRDNVALGCAPGEMRWNDLPLVQNPADASLWSANLGLGLSPTEVADRIRFIVFAAGKAGATSWATNQGPFYAIGANAVREVTSLTLDAPQDVSGPVGATISASAALLDDMGKPLANRSIVFGLAQQTRTGVTGADGRATVDLPIYGIPGTHDITASFPGSPVYAPSTAAPQSFVVSQQSSTLKLSAGASDPNEDAVFVATLVDGVSPDPNILAEQTVFFYFTDEKGATIIRTAITGLFGEARLGRDGYVDGIGEGTYRVFAEFKGSPSYSGSESNALEYQQGKTPASPSIQRLFLPSVSSIRIRAGDVSGARSEAGVVQLPFVTEK
ncbi:MAG: Ig-like domain-containing protein, partial [Caldilineaceae bacterium]